MCWMLASLSAREASVSFETAVTCGQLGTTPNTTITAVAFNKLLRVITTSCQVNQQSLGEVTAVVDQRFFPREHLGVSPVDGERPHAISSMPARDSRTC